jgi:hypothetical protein
MVGLPAAATSRSLLPLTPHWEALVARLKRRPEDIHQDKGIAI